MFDFDQMSSKLAGGHQWHERRALQNLRRQDAPQVL